MENTNIWLIYHKAIMSAVSPLNMDGSEWIEGICIVPADNVDAALEGYRDLLKKDHMEEIELYKVMLYQEQNHINDEFAKELARSVSLSKARGVATYIGTLTSEGFAEQQSDSGDE